VAPKAAAKLATNFRCNPKAARDRVSVCVLLLLILFAGRNNIVTSQSARHVLEQDESACLSHARFRFQDQQARPTKNGCRRRLKAHGRHVKFPVSMTELSSLITNRLHPSARPTVNVRTPASGAIFQTRASSAGQLEQSRPRFLAD
jgi:hypothetical protein